MIFDTHAHYDSEQFDEDRDALLWELHRQGVAAVVNVSASCESCFRVPEMVRDYPFMYAAVGVHPDETGGLDEEVFFRIKGQLGKEKVVAVGEIGLDYYWDKESRETQKEWFIRQLGMARERGLPVLIHSREAAADTMAVMKEHAKGLKGIIHCYSYSEEMAREYVEMGFCIGVGGVVTFKNGKKLKQAVKALPLEAIVLETDCPYLAPEPFRGKRNHSGYIRYVAEEIAALKGIAYEEVLARTEENARELFGLAGAPKRGR